MSRSMFRLLIIAAVLTFAACPVFAQGLPQIQGQVRLAPSNQPALQASIECSGPGCNGRIFTDRQGRFRFVMTSPGYYTVTVTLPGYITETRSYALLDYGSSEYADIRMRPDPAAISTPSAPPGVINASAVPPAARKEFEQGRDALSVEGKADEGIAHLEKAVKLYPKYFQARILLGEAYIDKQQPDKAESELRKALEIEPKSAEAHFALGEVYRQQKKYEEAEKILLEGLKLQDVWQGHMTLGRVYWDQGNIAKAGPQVGKALQQKPDLAEGHLLAGNILLRAHQAENAMTEFQEYLRLAPKGKFAPQAQAMVDKIKKALADQKK